MSGGLIDFISSIRRDVGDEAVFPAAPEDFDAHHVSYRSCAKGSNVVIATQVSATTHHFLALERHCPAVNEDLCAYAACVRSQPLQTDLNAWSYAVVAVNTHVVIEAVHHHIQITIIVQIRQRHPVAYPFVIKTPGCANFLETQIAHISKGHSRQPQAGIHQD